MYIGHAVLSILSGKKRISQKISKKHKKYQNAKHVNSVSAFFIFCTIDSTVFWHVRYSNAKLKKIFIFQTEFCVSCLCDLNNADAYISVSKNVKNSHKNVTPLPKYFVKYFEIRKSHFNVSISQIF